MEILNLIAEPSKDNKCQKDKEKQNGKEKNNLRQNIIDAIPEDEEIKRINKIIISKKNINSNSRNNNRNYFILGINTPNKKTEITNFTNQSTPKPLLVKKKTFDKYYKIDNYEKDFEETKKPIREKIEEILKEENNILNSGNNKLLFSYSGKKNLNLGNTRINEKQINDNNIFYKEEKDQKKIEQKDNNLYVFQDNEYKIKDEKKIENNQDNNIIINKFKTIAHKINKYTDRKDKRVILPKLENCFVNFGEGKDNKALLSNDFDNNVEDKVGKSINYNPIKLTPKKNCVNKFDNQSSINKLPLLKNLPIIKSPGLHSSKKNS